jgi:hypothetical protein
VVDHRHEPISLAAATCSPHVDGLYGGAGDDALDNSVTVTIGARRGSPISLEAVSVPHGNAIFGS